MQATNVTVRLYEVLWADVLRRDERGSFAIEMVQAAAWFPWLNRQHGLFGHLDPQPSSMKVWRSTARLVPTAALIHLVYWGLHRLTSRPPPGQEETDDDQPLDVGRSLGIASRADRELDKTAGDIFAYVKSAGGVVTPGSSLETAFSSIQGLVGEALTSADEQCDDVQILAHSLGTLIAFHAIAGFRASEAAVGHAPLEKLSRLYTIGSPLEKVRFVWPNLIPAMPVTAAAREGRTFEWTNFHNRLDVVSGKVDQVDRAMQVSVKNLSIWGGGALTSHVTYEQNRRFLGELTEGLGGHRCEPRARWWARAWGFISSVSETILGLGLIPVFLMLGLVALAGSAAAFLFVGLWANDQWSLGLAVWLSVLGAALFWYFIWGRRLANGAHQPWLEQHQQR